MSFLNPVNEPVTRFSSTDADAPQINYNSRVAGDVKAVLKACLVTGYGDKQSAGWSIVNEVDHVCEFVSPSAAMSDYRLGIDDASASSTTWYYQYQDVRVDPGDNKPTKNFTAGDNSHPDNGWELIVTDRGFVFIELLQQTPVNKLSARITYLSSVKSALLDTLGPNIMFFNIGQNAQAYYPRYLYGGTYPHLRLATHSEHRVYGGHVESLAQGGEDGVSVVDVISTLYIANETHRSMIAQIPGVLAKSVARTDSLYGVSVEYVDNSEFLQVTAGVVDTIGSVFLINLSTWEY